MKKLTKQWEKELLTAQQDQLEHTQTRAESINYSSEGRLSEAAELGVDRFRLRGGPSPCRFRTEEHGPADVGRKPVVSVQ